MDFSIEPNPAPLDAAKRTEILQSPGFGQAFTDHMVTIKYKDGIGWHDASVGTRGPILLDPATAVLHYAQEIFEGMKAYKLTDGSMALFRPDANAARFNRSAKRLAMPELPPELFLQSVQELVKIDQAWFPEVAGGSIYLRPFMFASEVFLGVRPSTEYLYMVIASPAGNYFKSGAPAIKIWVSEHYTRAAPGGTGAAKCGGNYAASLIAQSEAYENSCDQVVFLDAAEHRWVEELGGMNLFFLFDDGSLVTPPADGTILEGITRESLIILAREQGLNVREERYSMDQWRADAASGKLTEVFACGTAAVVTPVGSVHQSSGSFEIGAGGPGQITQKLRDQLVEIQRGNAADPHGWVQRIE
jgi:branched-chain amino acid aminotransferase